MQVSVWGHGSEPCTALDRILVASNDGTPTFIMQAKVQPGTMTKKDPVQNYALRKQVLEIARSAKSLQLGVAFVRVNVVVVSVGLQLRMTVPRPPHMPQDTSNFSRLRPTHWTEARCTFLNRLLA